MVYGNQKTAYEQRQETEGSGSIGDVVNALQDVEDENPLKLLTGQRNSTI